MPFAQDSESMSFPSTRSQTLSQSWWFVKASPACVELSTASSSLS